MSGETRNYFSTNCLVPSLHYHFRCWFSSMSLKNYHDTVQENDTVILYLGYDNMHAIKIKRGSVFQTKYGALRHNNIIGTTYGSRVQCPKGYLYVLYPTPELWTSNLPHRTQILYTTDISMVSFQLDLKPGAVVVESGTHLDCSDYYNFLCHFHSRIMHNDWMIPSKIYPINVMALLVFDVGINFIFDYRYWKYQIRKE